MNRRMSSTKIWNYDHISRFNNVFSRMICAWETSIGIIEIWKLNEIITWLFWMSGETQSCGLWAREFDTVNESFRITYEWEQLENPFSSFKLFKIFKKLLSIRGYSWKLTNDRVKIPNFQDKFEIFPPTQLTPCSAISEYTHWFL